MILSTFYKIALLYNEHVKIKPTIQELEAIHL